MVRWLAFMLVACCHAIVLQWVAAARPAPRAIEPPRPIQVALLEPPPPPPSPAPRLVPVVPPPEPEPRVERRTEPVRVPRPRPSTRPAAPRPTPAPVVTPPPLSAPESAPAPAIVETPLVQTPPPAEVVPPPADVVAPVAPPPPPPVVAARAVPPREPVPDPVVPPSFSADYLSNPAPRYPSLSRRIGEEGRVLLRVFVKADGHPSRIELRTTSGFERLDDAAMSSVRTWRFVPARQGDRSVDAWVLIPIDFRLREGT